MELTVRETAVLKLFLKNSPKAWPLQLRALLCILTETGHVSLQEIEESTLISNGRLQGILKQLEKSQLVERDGCLYRKPESERIAQAIECK